MLTEVCQHIRNYFLTTLVVNGKFNIVGGVVDLPSIKDGQYFLVSGSTFNDGIHQDKRELIDEEFEGTITGLAIPPSFIALVEEIKAYNDKATNVGPYTSESFHNYSRSVATNKHGVAASWQDAFATRLNAWRKI